MAVSIAVVIWLFGAVSNLTDSLLLLVPKEWIRNGEGPLHLYSRVFALLVAILLIGLVGRLGRYYFGKKLIQGVDVVLMRVPLLNRIYTGLKQIHEAFTSSKAASFKQVVLVEFPRPGLYSIGFITGAQNAEAQSEDAKAVAGGFRAHSAPDQRFHCPRARSRRGQARDVCSRRHQIHHEPGFGLPGLPFSRTGLNRRGGGHSKGLVSAEMARRIGTLSRLPCLQVLSFIQNFHRTFMSLSKQIGQPILKQSANSVASVSALLLGRLGKAWSNWWHCAFSKVSHREDDRSGSGNLSRAGHRTGSGQRGPHFGIGRKMSGSANPGV